MAIQPLNDRVLIKRVQSEERTAGGLIIPDTAKEKPLEAVVEAVGPGKVADSGARVEPQVKKGDRILFGKYSGTEISVGGEDFLILREEEILAILIED
mgnify:CR=1 FL=1